jgi:hypothetical protein
MGLVELVAVRATLGGKKPCVVEDISTSPSFLTVRIVLLALPTFNAAVAEVVPAPTTSNLLDGVGVPIPTWADSNAVLRSNKERKISLVLEFI